MGMAASQARLLSITSRMHDVELRAQNIENQKISLATQQDEAYEKYCDALDSKKIQIAMRGANDINLSYIDANFANMTEYSENRQVQYCLKDAESGRVIVDKDTKEMYDNYFNDKYSFAWAMMGLDGRFGWDCTDGELSGAKVGINSNDGSENEDGNLLMSEVEQEFFNSINKEDSKYSKLVKAYDDYLLSCENDDKSKQRDMLRAFRDELYSSQENRQALYKLMCLDKNDDKDLTLEENIYSEINPDEVPFENNKFNFYVRLFENIQNCGGCVSIDTICEDGDSGNAWLNANVSSGRVLIDIYNQNRKEWTPTSVSTSTNQNYLQEIADEVKIKKAEAEYEHEMTVIKGKDKKFDMELKKLETERTALKTEVDSIKTVRNDNTERTFGIFS